MPKIKHKDEEEKKVVSRRIYNDRELWEFNNEMNLKYRYKKTLSNGMEVSLLDYQKYHNDQGSMKGDAVVEKYVGGYIYYEIIEDKIRQLNEWKAKKEYASKKKMEDIQKIVDETVPKPL